VRKLVVWYEEGKVCEKVDLGGDFQGVTFENMSRCRTGTKSVFVDSVDARTPRYFPMHAGYDKSRSRQDLVVKCTALVNESNASEQSNHQKPHRSHKPEEREPSHTP